jgi:Fe-S oxidoreductase
VAAVEKGEVDPEEYSSLFPDRKGSVMQLYRSYYGIGYSDLEAEKGATSCFFPGCTLMTYSPVLTREVFMKLKNECGCQGLLTDCCGILLSQFGLEQSAAEASRNLVDKVESLGIKRIIVACPGCYYSLQEILGQKKVEILTIYEVLDFQGAAGADAPLCTVHDSCPDRFKGVFSKGVREALKKSGFSLVEMADSREETLCCGSGALVSHFRPERTEKLIELRLRAAEKSGAKVLLAYCLSCVLNYAARPSEVKVRHVLNLLLGIDEDYTDVKTKVVKVFEEANG